jgi:hypothetical protein
MKDIKITNIELPIKDNIFDINLIFYNFLKKITQAKLTNSQIINLLVSYSSNKNLNIDNLKEIFYSYVENSIKRKDLSKIYSLLSEIDENNIDIFIFSLKLNIIKDFLLKQDKISEISKIEKLEKFDQLSLSYDKISTQVAYSVRINGALRSFFFFEKLEEGNTSFISSSSEEFLQNLKKTFDLLSKKDVKLNQIFMLLFSESINQSIISSAGISYEERVRNALLSIGIKNEDIQKIHDIDDRSTEFDFFFECDGRKFGIGAKRTLRERYKQFIKTAHMSKVDIMIEITLGTDLRENMANSIRQHDVYLFVADEVYNEKEFLKQKDGIYPASALTLDLLKNLK